MGNRASSPRDDGNSSLPHNDNREETQPYAKEVEDYQQGVTKPPEEQGGRKIKKRNRNDKGPEVRRAGAFPLARLNRMVTPRSFQAEHRRPCAEILLLPPAPFPSMPSEGG